MKKAAPGVKAALVYWLGHQSKGSVTRCVKLTSGTPVGSYSRGAPDFTAEQERDPESLARHDRVPRVLPQESVRDFGACSTGKRSESEDIPPEGS